MGKQVLIICFVVVVIGGIGSINGALIASLLIGLADTFGKVLAPESSGVAVYLLMAAILLWRPAGPRQQDRTRAVTPSAHAALGSCSPSCCCSRCFPLVGATFYIQLGAKIMIMAIFALEPRSARRPYRIG